MPNLVVSTNIPNVKILIDETRRIRARGLRDWKSSDASRLGLISPRFVRKIQYGKLGERRMDSVKVESRQTEEFEISRLLREKFEILR